MIFALKSLADRSSFVLWFFVVLSDGQLVFNITKFSQQGTETRISKSKLTGTGLFAIASVLWLASESNVLSTLCYLLFACLEYYVLQSAVKPTPVLASLFAKLGLTM